MKKSAKIKTIWHQENPMPKNPILEQRVSRHIAEVMFKTVLFVFVFVCGIAYAETSGFDVPDLQLWNLQGQLEQLSDYRGRIVVLNFWATWCVPCRKEMPLFVELQKEFGSRGVQFIGVFVDTKETQTQVAEFVKKYHIDFPIWLGGTSDQQASFQLATGIPATVPLFEEKVLTQSNFTIH
jgi:thiol-disulfide isomerase/thioredoxin